MGGIKKKKAKRGIEHHKRSLEETLEAPETYGVRVSEALRAKDATALDILAPHSQQTCAEQSACADEDKAGKTAKSSCLSSSR